MSTSDVAAEVEWVVVARQFIEGDDVDDEISEDGEDVGDGGGGWATTVARELAIEKPEAYVPQMVAVGPYHRNRPELREMEWWKLSVVRMLQRSSCSGVTFVQIVDAVKGKERAIRSHYHRYVNCMDGETLAWTMAIDASFVVEFLQSSMSNASILSDPHNASILSDLLRLENQIPLFLLEMVVSKHRCPSEDKELLSVLLANFVKCVHPFRLGAETHLKKTSRRHKHLLDLLHHNIVPEKEHDFHSSDDDPREPCPVESPVLLVLGCFKNVLVSFLIRVIRVMFVCFPMLAIVGKAPLEQMLNQSSADDDESFEMDIPSASDLADAGVTFVATNGGLSSVRFDVKLETFFMPAMRIAPHTEVMLRNLVAMEVAWRQNHHHHHHQQQQQQQKPWVLTWYVQVMKGIVDTAEDVHVLRQCGVLKSYNWSDEDVAQLWNGMVMARRGCSSFGGHLLQGMGMDELVTSLNVWYRRNRWKVKIRRMLKKATKVGSTFDFTNFSSLVFLCFAVVLVAMHLFCFFHHCGV